MKQWSYTVQPQQLAVSPAWTAELCVGEPQIPEFREAEDPEIFFFALNG